MNVLGVFRNPELAEQSADIAETVNDAMTGFRVDVCLAAMFSLFIATCHQNKADPGATFETLLSAFEKRAASTHRGNTQVH